MTVESHLSVESETLLSWQIGCHVFLSLVRKIRFIKMADHEILFIYYIFCFYKLSDNKLWLHYIEVPISLKSFENSFPSYYRKIVWCQHPLYFAITLNFIAKMTQRVSVMFSVLYNDTYVTNSQALPFTCLFIN